MENERKYTINIGSFGEHEDRCLSASFGGIGVQTDTIPWADTEHNPWDYKALYEEVEEEIEIYDPTDLDAPPSHHMETVKQYTGEFVLDVIEMPTPVAVPTAEERLEALEAVLLEMMGV